MKSLILTACEKVIQDPTSGPSLIATFYEMKIAVPSSADVPRDAALPKEWAVFSLWRLEESELGKAYALGVEIRWPNGEPFYQGKIVLTQPATRIITYIVRLTAFPMGQNGRITIAVWMEDEGKVVSEKIDTDVTVLVERNDSAFSAAGVP